MKILYYINDLGSGGAERLLMEIMPIMKRQGHDVQLAVSNKKKSFLNYERIIDASGIQLIDFNTSTYNPFQIIRLSILLRRRKYNIVCATLFPSQYWLAFASLVKPRSTRLIMRECNTYNIRRDFKWLRPVERWIYSRFDRTIAITNLVKETLIDWTGIRMESKIVIIRNGVNLEKVAASKINSNEWSYEFLSRNNYNILMVARFDEDQKDHATVIKALQQLSSKYRLFLVGEGVAVNKVRQLVTDLGLKEKVNFLGVRRDVYKLMNSVDLNVLSSNYEGSSGVALESLASGKPFIGSDVPGIKDIVPDSSFLFPKGDFTVLAKMIKDIAENESLGNQMVHKGLSHVEGFDIQIMADNYLKLYESVLKFEGDRNL